MKRRNYQKRRFLSLLEVKPASDDREKELYLIQLQHLDEQLERYQQKNDKLEREENDLNAQLISLEKEKKDIIDYLKRSLLEKEEEVEELTERLASQQQAADQDRDAEQLQYSQLREELQDRIKELTAENKKLAAKLDSLDEFQRQKEELESNMESLQMQLTALEQEHKAGIHNLEMKVLLEKKRLEKEMESQVAAIAADVQHQVDQKVPETTRTALQENTVLKVQLNQLSKETQVLMEENSSLLQQKGRLIVDVQNLEEMLKETTCRSCILQKVVEQLTGKCEQLQTELKERSQDLVQLQTQNTGLQAEMETLRQDETSLMEQGRKNTAKVSRLEEELQKERRSRSRMKSIMQEGARMLKEALMEAPTEQDLVVDSVVQWRQLMQRLLLVLDRQTLNSSTTEGDRLDEQQMSDPATAGEITLNPALNFQFELARHRLADLGIVPRPSAKSKHMISSSTSVPLYRKPSSHQTTSSYNPRDSTVKFLTSRNNFRKSKPQ